VKDFTDPVRAESGDTAVYTDNTAVSRSGHAVGLYGSSDNIRRNLIAGPAIKLYASHSHGWIFNDTSDGMGTASAAIRKWECSPAKLGRAAE
jgi:hypothetical protein